MFVCLESDIFKVLYIVLGSQTGECSKPQMVYTDQVLKVHKHTDIFSIFDVCVEIRLM